MRLKFAKGDHLGGVLLYEVLCIWQAYANANAFD
jgi:hypothetical protein